MGKRSAKRSRKCPGCLRPGADHSFGPRSKFCEGPPGSNTPSHENGSDVSDGDTTKTAFPAKCTAAEEKSTVEELKAQLERLTIDEEALEKELESRTPKERTSHRQVAPISDQSDEETY